MLREGGKKMNSWKRWNVWAAAGILSLAGAFTASAQEPESEAETEAMVWMEPETETEAMAWMEPAPGEMSPIEELADIFKNQEFPGGTASAALGETLGISSLADSIESKGVSASLRLYLGEEITGLPNTGHSLNEFANLNFQYSPIENAWSLGGGLSLLGQELVSASLFADEDALALSIPELFEGTIGVRSGSLFEQYQDSALSYLAGELPLPQDIDLFFVPGEEEIVSEIGEDWQDWADELKKTAEDTIEDIQVEKAEEGDEDIYTVCFLTEDLEDCYLEFVDAYLDGMERMKIISKREATELRGELFTVDTLMAFDALDEEFVNGTIRVRDGAIKEIYLEVSLQGEEEGQNSWEPESELYPEGYQGVVNMPEDLIFRAEIENGRMDAQVSLREAQYEKAVAEIKVRSSAGADSAMDTWEVSFSYDPRGRYNTISRAETYFDRKTGKYETRCMFQDEYGTFAGGGMEYTFSQIVPGESFLCTLESADFQVEYETIDVTMGMELSVDTSGPAVEKPENTRMIMEMSQTELFDLLDEVDMNAEILDELFSFGSSSSADQEYEDETEDESEDYFYETYDGMREETQ